MRSSRTVIESLWLERADGECTPLQNATVRECHGGSVAELFFDADSGAVLVVVNGAQEAASLLNAMQAIHDFMRVMEDRSVVRDATENGGKK